MIRIVHADGGLTLFEGDKPCGGVVFTVEGDTLTLQTLDAPDDTLGEGLVRAALNVGRSQGAKTAVCREPLLRPLLKKLRFASAMEDWTVDIASFFARGCRK